jgi:hypothetical protein
MPLSSIHLILGRNHIFKIVMKGIWHDFILYIKPSWIMRIILLLTALKLLQKIEIDLAWFDSLDNLIVTIDSYRWGWRSSINKLKIIVRSLSWSKDGFSSLKCIESLKTILLHETNVVEGYSIDDNRILCLYLWYFRMNIWETVFFY